MAPAILLGIAHGHTASNAHLAREASLEISFDASLRCRPQPTKRAQIATEGKHAGTTCWLQHVARIDVDVDDKVSGLQLHLDFPLYRVHRRALEERTVFSELLCKIYSFAHPYAVKNNTLVPVALRLALQRPGVARHARHVEDEPSHPLALLVRSVRVLQHDRMHETCLVVNAAIRLRTPRVDPASIVHDPRVNLMVCCNFDSYISVIIRKNCSDVPTSCGRKPAHHVAVAAALAIIKILGDTSKDLVLNVPIVARS